MATILLVGNDPALLSTRAAVLNRTGCKTVRSTIPDALPVLAEQEVKLVVLCHTLPELPCLAMSRTIRRRWPTTRILQVLPLGGECEYGYASAADASSDSRPECLLKAAAQLLGYRPPPPVEISRWKAAASFY